MFVASKSTTFKVTSRVKEIVRASVTACILPIFFLYIFLGKPDYKIMRAATGIVVPVARTLGDIVTWPVRAVGHLAKNVGEHSRALEENRKLRAQLDAALASQNECVTIMAENQRLTGILDFAKARPQKTTLSRVMLENNAFRAATIIIDKGETSGIGEGQVALSTDGYMVGIVVDVNSISSRVRTLNDAKSNIPVRVTGTGVYGFLRGTGTNHPVFEFFSDQEFKPGIGIRLVTSGIRGNIPDDIPVGTVISDTVGDVRVRLGRPGSSVHEVVVLGFDGKGGYKN